MTGWEMTRKGPAADDPAQAARPFQDGGGDG